MHKSTTEHSTPEIVGEFKVYTIRGANFEVPLHYKVIRVIGVGAQSLNCSAINTITNEKVAIKKYRDIFRDAEDGRKALREIALLRFLNRHDNLLGVVDILPPMRGPRFLEVYAVTPLMDVEMNVVLRSRQVLEESHFMWFVHQVLRGLKYLHSANIVHRDLKPENLLVNVSCDLRISGMLSLEHMDPERVIMRWYQAPEALLGLPVACRGPAVDIWSTGCIFAELYARKPLFPGKTSTEQLRMLFHAFGKPKNIEALTDNADAIKMLKTFPESEPIPLQKLVPKMTNPVALDLLSKMLVMDPKERWTAEMLLEHPFFTDVHDAADEPRCTEKFQWEFGMDKEIMSFEQIREGFWREICGFNPQYMETK